jgi:hypothetical protein
MNYDVDYFIQKFTAIPEESWNVGYHNYIDQAGRLTHCAMGHCGNSLYKPSTPEASALWKLFTDNINLNPVQVNDGNSGISDLFPQSTPRQRILAALEMIKTEL